ncbi:hypothetical protein, partial [Xanthomonas euvesicatoria]|uniref:hypothetical protein n=1 Tax=Xanthomonas euvesicatoria TaxID=456327 RepID=UPI0019D35C82
MSSKRNGSPNILISFACASEVVEPGSVWHRELSIDKFAQFFGNFLATVERANNVVVGKRVLPRY